MQSKMMPACRGASECSQRSSCSLPVNVNEDDVRMFLVRGCPCWLVVHAFLWCMLSHTLLVFKSPVQHDTAGQLAGGACNCCLC
jgi:hypothetical protein